MPTPADIIDLARQWGAEERPPNKNYYQDLLKSIEGEDPKRAPKVSWYGKQWPDFTEQERIDFVLSLDDMTPQKRDEYIKYMKNHFGLIY